MAYPKPLSQKNIEKMYNAADIDDKKRDFLHKFFLAAANLYGIVSLKDLWDIFKEIRDDYGVKNIKRKDIINFSSIARREDVPYYVFEIDELYTDENRSDLLREIVLKEAVSPYSFNIGDYYDLLERQQGKPFYIPDNYLDYAEPVFTQQDEKLLAYLKGLRVTAGEGTDYRGRRVVCEHIGKKLGDFSFMNTIEKFHLQYYSGELKGNSGRNEKAVRHILKETSCSEGEKIFNTFKRSIKLGRRKFVDIIKDINEEFNEVGVIMDIKELNRMVGLIMEANNHCNLWLNRGWSPSGLAALCAPERSGIPAVHMGKNIKAAIARGDIRREDIEAQCREMGIKPVWD